MSATIRLFEHQSTKWAYWDARRHRTSNHRASPEEGFSRSLDPASQSCKPRDNHRERPHSQLGLLLGAGDTCTSAMRSEHRYRCQPERTACNSCSAQNCGNRIPASDRLIVSESPDIGARQRGGCQIRTPIVRVHPDLSPRAPSLIRPMRQDCESITALLDLLLPIPLLAHRRFQMFLRVPIRHQSLRCCARRSEGSGLVVRHKCRGVHR